MGNSDWVHLDVDEIKHETEKSFLVLIDGEEIWIPKSQVSDPDDYTVGDMDCVVSVSEWFAKKEGLE